MRVDEVKSGRCAPMSQKTWFDVFFRERLLQQWDFLHCAPGTRHGFVGAGEGACVLLMTGARTPGRTVEYPDQGATSAQEAYAGFPHWQPGPRPGFP